MAINLVNFDEKTLCIDEHKKELSDRNIKRLFMIGDVIRKSTYGFFSRVFNPYNICSSSNQIYKKHPLMVREERIAYFHVDKNSVDIISSDRDFIRRLMRSGVDKKLKDFVINIEYQSTEDI